MAEYPSYDEWLGVGKTVNLRKQVLDTIRTIIEGTVSAPRAIEKIKKYTKKYKEIEAVIEAKHFQDSTPTIEIYTSTNKYIFRTTKYATVPPAVV